MRWLILKKSKINEEKNEYLTELHVLKLSAIDDTKQEPQANIGMIDNTLFMKN